jgi:hypothetical protein
MMKYLAMCLLLSGLGVVAHAAAAATLDDLPPLLCAPATILECEAAGGCARTTLEAANVPPFVKIDPAATTVSTLDGRRTSAISQADTLQDRVVLYGGDGARGCMLVISDAGQMTATAATDRHTFVLFGACTRLAGGGK